MIGGKYLFKLKLEHHIAAGHKFICVIQQLQTEIWGH